MSQGRRLRQVGSRGRVMNLKIEESTKHDKGAEEHRCGLGAWSL